MSATDFQPTLTITTSANTSTGTTTLTENSTAMAKKVACSNCGTEVPMGAKTCLACGKKVSAAAEDVVEAGVEIEIEINEEEPDDCCCPGCGAMNDASAQVCDQCGGDMAGVTPGEDTPEMPDMPDMPDMSTLPTWESEMAYEGLATSDGRLLMAGKITNRDLPLTVMAQTVTAEGHMGAEVCGKLTSIWREDRPELGDGVVAIMGVGEFSDELMGPTAASLVEDQVLRGVSVDISATKRLCLDANTLEVVPEGEMDMQTYMDGGYLVGIEGEIMGCTLVPFPAFASANMKITTGGESTVTASAGLNVKLIPRSITAAAAGIAPIAPPMDWFFTPEAEGKFPLTVMDDGRIMGHLATWDQCHHGFMNECVLAKPSRTEYSFFHVGALKTKEGEFVDVGRIIVGETAQAGHASVEYSGADASKHYDKTALVGAFVRAVDGKYGIWLSGVVRSDCPAERVRDMLANPPSGDWRRENGWLELIAALSVPVPGFPVPRYEYAMVASGESAEVKTMIATGYYEVDPPSFSRAEQRRREVLISKAKALV
jgi:ribosomal protein L40E